MTQEANPRVTSPQTESQQLACRVTTARPELSGSRRRLSENRRRPLASTRVLPGRSWLRTHAAVQFNIISEARVVLPVSSSMTRQEIADPVDCFACPATDSRDSLPTLAA